MADNITLKNDDTTSVGTLAADDIGGVLYTRNKLIHGADGTNDGDVSSSNPLPTTDAATQVDDAAFTPASSSVIMVGATFDDTTPDSVDEGDGGAVRMSANRNLYTQIRDAAGNERGVNVNASNQMLVSADTELPAAAALGDDTANPTAPAVAAFGMAWDGSTWDRMKGTAADGLLVNLGSNNDVSLNAGTNAIGKLGENDGVDIGDVSINAASGTPADTVNVSTILFGIAGNLGGTLSMPTMTTVGADSALDVYLTSTALRTDNAGFTPGSQEVLMAGATFDDTSPDEVDEGDAGAMRMSSRRELYTQIRDAGGNERGVNVNASNQMLVSEANSADALTALQIIDDWDESDRAKVNLIAGQAGITAGAGAVGASTPRVTLASDDPAVVALQILDNAISGNEMQCDVVTQPARAATTDTITAKLATDAIQDGTTALTPKFAAIDAASSGDNTLVAAVVGKKLRVLSLMLVAGGDVDVRLEDGAGGTALTGQMDLTANSGFTLPFNPVGWFETTANTLLNLELSGAVSCDGCLVYVEV